MITITEPAPVAAIKLIAEKLRTYGATIEPITPTSGIFTHVTGRGSYRHDGESLTVEITSHAGMFAENLLKGGIRQLIQDATEDAAMAAPPRTGIGSV